MKRFLLMFVMPCVIAAPAIAASVTNKDAATQVLVVVEGESRVELPLEPGMTETICPSGCFVTLPNGDRLPLSGEETVDIEGGSASVK